jgi:hypothetical protein
VSRDQRWLVVGHDAGFESHESHAGQRGVGTASFQQLVSTPEVSETVFAGDWVLRQRADWVLESSCGSLVLTFRFHRPKSDLGEDARDPEWESFVLLGIKEGRKSGHKVEAGSEVVEVNR